VTEQAAGLVDSALPLAEARPVASWGRPPVGRWGTPARGPVRPLFAAAVNAGERLAPARYAVLGSPPAWRPPGELRGRTGRAASAAHRAGLLFDWGGEVYGYLTLQIRGRGARPAALLFTGADPVDPLAGRRNPGGGAAPPVELGSGAPVVVVPGQRTWTDTVPRRFRYTAVVALRGLEKAWVTPVVEGEGTREAGRLPSPPAAGVPGVFGVAPPPLRTPVEDEVWRELQRLADLAGGEDL